MLIVARLKVSILASLNKKHEKKLQFSWGDSREELNILFWWLDLAFEQKEARPLLI